MHLVKTQQKYSGPLVGYLIAVTLLVMGSAVEKAPVKARMFEFSAATTVVPNGSDLTVSLEAGGGPTASVLVANDNAGGGSDLLVSFESTSAAAPGTTAASTTLRLKAGNMINFDGRWYRATLRGDGGTVSARVIATY